MSQSFQSPLLNVLGLQNVARAPGRPTASLNRTDGRSGVQIASNHGITHGISDVAFVHRGALSGIEVAEERVLGMSVRAAAVAPLPRFQDGSGSDESA